MIHFPALNAMRVFLDKVPGNWLPALSTMPVPEVFVLGDLRRDLGFIPDRLLLVALKGFVSDKLPWYWIPALNKVPVYKVFVLDLLEHLAIIRYRIPAFILLKRCVPDKSPE